MSTSQNSLLLLVLKLKRSLNLLTPESKSFSSNRKTWSSSCLKVWFIVSSVPWKLNAVWIVRNSLDLIKISQIGIRLNNLVALKEHFTRKHISYHLRQSYLVTSSGTCKTTFDLWCCTAKALINSMEGSALVLQYRSPKMITMYGILCTYIANHLATEIPLRREFPIWKWH